MSDNWTNGDKFISQWITVIITDLKNASTEFRTKYSSPQSDAQSNQRTRCHYCWAHFLHCPYSVWAQTTVQIDGSVHRNANAIVCPKSPDSFELKSPPNTNNCYTVSKQSCDGAAVRMPNSVEWGQLMARSLWGSNARGKRNSITAELGATSSELIHGWWAKVVVPKTTSRDVSSTRKEVPLK